MKKALLFIPAFFLAMLTFAQGKQKQVTTKSGDKIEFIQGQAKTLNGKLIVRKFPEENQTFQSISAAVQTAVKEELIRSGKGSYCFNINNIIINERGNIVYYESDGVSPFSCTGPLRKGMALTADEQETLNKLLDNAIAKLTVATTTVNGKAAPSMLSAISAEFTTNN